jgi:hypothetical protein
VPTLRWSRAFHYFRDAVALKCFPLVWFTADPSEGDC